MLEVPGRVVPLSDVLALEDMPVLLPLAESTPVTVLDVEEAESAEVEFTVDAPRVLLRLPEASAEVEEAGEETPAVDEAVRSALPGDAVAPDPAPEEDPAVFDVVDADELLVNED